MSEAKIVLSAVDQTAAAFASATKNLEGLKTTAVSVLGALGAATSAAGFLALIKGSIDAADHLNDLGKSTGLAVEELAGLKLLARQSGTDLDGLAKGVNRMSVEMGKAPEKFLALGITAKSNKEALQQFADVFNLLPDVQQRNALAQAVFAKSWAEMAPALAEGGKKIGETIEKGALLSGSTKEMSVAADEFNDKLAELAGTGGFLNRQVAPLLPLLNTLADDMLEAQGKSAGLAGEFHPLAEAFRALVVLGGNVSFVLKGIGNDMGAMAAQVAALGRGNLTGFLEIGKEAKTDAEAARVAFDKWEKGVMSVGTAIAAVGDTSDAMSRRLAGSARGEQQAAAARAAAFLAGQDAAKAATGEYDSLIKSIEEKIAAQDQELQKGRELTEFEKFEIKILTDLDATKKILSATQKQAVKDKLAEATATSLLVMAQKEEAKQGKALNQFYIDQEKDLSTDQVDRANERDRVNKGIADQATALQDSNQQLRLEATLMGATEKQRAIMLGNLQIELETKHKIEEVDRNLKLSESERVGMRANINNNADAQRAQLAERAALDEQLSMINSIESTAHSVWTNIFDGGKNAFTKLRDTLKATLLDLLYQMTMKQWVLQIGASITGSTGSLAQAAMGSAGGLGNLGSLGNLGGMLGNFGAGLAGTGGSFASSVGAGLATDAMGATVSAGSAAATLGSASSIGSMMAAIPGWGWAALAAAAVVSFMNHGGGPKTEGGYAAGGLSIAGKDIGGNLQGSQRGDVSNAQSISQGISASYAALANTLGLLDKKLDVGIFYSMDNAKGGTSLTQLQVTSSTGYNRSDRVGGIENVARGDDALKAALAEETVRLLIDGLKGSDLPQQFKDVLNSIAPEAGIADMQAAIDRVTTARSQQLSLEETLFQLTSTDAEKLARTREKERAAIDPLNKALLDQVYAQQDLKTATDAATAAASAAADKAKAIASEKLGLEKQIMQLTGDTAGLRKLELDALDASNRSLQERIYALQDEANATKAANAANQAYGQLQTDIANHVVQDRLDQARALFDAGKGISDFIKQLTTGRAGTASPEQLLAATRTNYLADLSGARNGNVDASGRITGSAQAYIDAQKGYTASGGATQAVISQVISELNGLPSVQSYQDQSLALARQQLAAMLQLGTLLGSTALPAGAGAAVPRWSEPGWTDPISYEYHPPVPHYAAGADSHPGGWAMVGERGPELAHLPAQTRVYTAQDTQRMMGGDNTSSESAAEQRRTTAEVGRLIRVQAVANNALIERMGALVQSSERMGDRLALLEQAR
jgi:hypothetical protein